MDYIPEYAEGEILLKLGTAYGHDFSTDVDFIRDFSKYLGFEYKEEWRDSGDYHVISVSPGKEAEACEKFMSYNFVENAERRDLKLEARWDMRDDVVFILGNVDYDNLSDEEYKKKMTEIADLLLKSR